MEPEIDCYCEVVIDELLQLTGCKLYDAYQKAPFQLKLKLLYYIMDFPGLAKFFHTVGSAGYRACPWCSAVGTRCSHLQKIVFLENRKFLKKEHILRQNSTHFPLKAAELEGAPLDISPSLEHEYRQTLYQTMTISAHRNSLAKETGPTGRYSAMQLEEHCSVEQTSPDAMHAICDVVDIIFKLLTGKSDTVHKARRTGLEGLKVHG